MRWCAESKSSGNAGTRVCLIALYSAASIGLRYLASMLQRKGFAVSMVFFKDKDIALDLMERPTGKEYELLLEVVEQLEPDVVGMCVRSSFLVIAKEITSRIKAKLGIPVIWGGTHPTVAPAESIRFADAVCLGEGEHAILKLAESLARREEPSNIANMWFKASGAVLKNPIGPLYNDLDSLPFPDYGDEEKYLVNNDEVSAGDPGKKLFNLDVLTSRGCPYRCSYCSNSILRDLYQGKGPTVRRRSAKNVLDEIKVQAERLPNLMRIDFIDEVFSWDKAWVEEFVEEYKRQIGLPFHCMQHPLTVNREIMRMLKYAGLERVEIGIQSGSERIRAELFERPVLDKNLVETSQIMRELGIVPFYDIIADNPFETTEDKRKGLNLLLKIDRPFHLHIFALMYFPNTTLTRKALAAGLISEDRIEGRATECFDQWFVSLGHPRKKEDRYWLSLYSLASKGFIPKSLIAMLSRLDALRKHPAPLLLFADACNYLKLALIAIKYISEGKPVFRSFGKRQKSGKSGSPIV
jgi:anaerobic magnesium-protoporphyrin IX monomethyl ester cyclase